MSINMQSSLLDNPTKIKGEKLMAQGFASKTRLKGDWDARRNLENPASMIISLILDSPAWAPSAGPFSFSEDGTQTSVEAE
jgi:hypothetical protein